MSDSEGGAGCGGSIWLFIVLLINMFLFCYEAALEHVQFTDEVSTEEEGGKILIRLKSMVMQPSKFLHTFQLLTTGVYLFLGSTYVIEWAEYFALKMENVHQLIPYFIALLLMLFLILIFGMFIPKCFGKKYTLPILRAGYPIIWLLMFLLTPFTILIRLISDLLLIIFRMKDYEKISDITEQGILSMVNEGQEIGVLEPSEAEMISNIFEYGEKSASDIMIHRKNIIAIESDIKLSNAIDVIANENYSRIPVYTDTIDNIIGILHLKDLMRFYKNTELLNKPLHAIDGIIRDVSFIPETRKIDDIFKMMQKSKEQMVIVIDEYGQTSGIVAMEDILEEIVGDILDEYDEEEEIATEFSEHEFVVSGQTRLEDLEEKLEVQFDEEDFDTINGYIISKLDRIPNDDEEFSFVLGQYIFAIERVEDKMIHSVRIKKIDHTEEEFEENIKEERNG